MVDDGFASYDIPVSDGDVIGVELRPVIHGGEPCRELLLTVPLAVTAGEIVDALRSLDVPADAPILRYERRNEFPAGLILVFRMA